MLTVLANLEILSFSVLFLALNLCIFIMLAPLANKGFSSIIYDILALGLISKPIALAFKVNIFSYLLNIFLKQTSTSSTTLALTAYSIHTCIIAGNAINLVLIYVLFISVLALLHRVAFAW